MTDLLLSQIKPGGESQFGTDEYVVNMGPQHPATHGVLRLVVKLDGETIKETMPVLGYLHRSIEKVLAKTGLILNVLPIQTGSTMFPP